jgi:hypothetical protein
MASSVLGLDVEMGLPLGIQYYLEVASGQSFHYVGCLAADAAA